MDIVLSRQFTAGGDVVLSRQFTTEAAAPIASGGAVEFLPEQRKSPEARLRVLLALFNLGAFHG